MLARPHQILAIRQSNIVGLILPHTWATAKRHIQASSLIYFWPEKEALFTQAQAGDFWRISPKLHRGEIEKLEVNYAKATNAKK